MSRKVFTAGEVLAAADVNSFLMDQTVMSFAGTAARGSAIPSPVEGMTTFLEDQDQVEIYYNSAWQIPYGIVPLVSQTFTSTTSLIISNCFSAKFDNYFLQVTQTGGGNCRFQIRTGTTTRTTGYGGSVVFAAGATPSAATRSGSFFECFGDFVSGYIYSPFLPSITGWQAISTSGLTTPGLDAAFQTLASSHESLVLSFGTNATGNIRIYGIRK